MRGDVILDVEHGQLAALVVDQVDLGEGDHAVADPEQFEDAEVLLGLRLPPFGRGDHEQAGIHAADPRQHVAQEAHVTGDVDEADPGARRQRRVGEPQIDREPAPLLLLEAIGIGARQRQHERRLPVIDVAGSGDDSQCGAHEIARSAWMRSASSSGSTPRRSR